MNEATVLSRPLAATPGKAEVGEQSEMGLLGPWSQD